MKDLRVGELVARVRAGDPVAWQSLTDRYTNLLWAVARGMRLSRADAADVVQTTWLRLLENIGRLTDPPRVGAWLATTARRECLRFQARSRRFVLVPELLDPVTDPLHGGQPGPEAGLIADFGPGP